MIKLENVIKKIFKKYHNFSQMNNWKYILFTWDIKETNNKKIVYYTTKKETYDKLKKDNVKVFFNYDEMIKWFNDYLIDNEEIYFNWDIYSIKIYNRVLSPTEVQKFYIVKK